MDSDPVATLLLGTPGLGVRQSKEEYLTLLRALPLPNVAWHDVAHEPHVATVCAESGQRTHLALRVSPCRCIRAHTSERLSLSDRKTVTAYVF